MTRNVRALFDHIENFLLTASPQDARDALNLLSALRGPDDNSGSDKTFGTMPIRAALFPKIYDQFSDEGFFPTPSGNGWGLRPANTLDLTKVIGLGHFQEHILYAATALKREDPK